MYIQYKDK